jgi:excisionase family DNA binding protein
MPSKPMTRPKPFTASSLLTIPEVAEQWHVHQNTVYREIKRGQLRAVKIAGAWRISREDFDAYMQDRAS